MAALCDLTPARTRSMPRSNADGRSAPTAPTAVCCTRAWRLLPLLPETENVVPVPSLPLLSPSCRAAGHSWISSAAMVRMKMRSPAARASTQAAKQQRRRAAKTSAMMRCATESNVGGGWVGGEHCSAEATSRKHSCPSYTVCWWLVACGTGCSGWWVPGQFAAAAHRRTPPQLLLTPSPRPLPLPLLPGLFHSTSCFPPRLWPHRTRRSSKAMTRTRRMMRMRAARG